MCYVRLFTKTNFNMSMMLWTVYSAHLITHCMGFLNFHKMNFRLQEKNIRVSNCIANKDYLGIALLVKHKQTMMFIYIYITYHLFYIKHQHTDKSIFELFMFVLYFHFTLSEITYISLTVRILYNYEYIRVSYEPKLINIFWR